MCLNPAYNLFPLKRLSDVIHTLPALKPRTTSSTSVLAVTKMTGISLAAGLAFNLSQVSNPSIPGTTTSNKIKSGRFFSTKFKVDSPFMAIHISKPSSSRMRHNTSMLAGVRQQPSLSPAKAVKEKHHRPAWRWPVR